MNKQFFKFDFITENLSETQVELIWDKIVSLVEAQKGFITGLYVEKTLEQLLKESEEYKDEYNQTDTTKID
jgi:hypothetical protein